jgi:tetratricopeptide (TPR) repeat protein
VAAAASVMFVPPQKTGPYQNPAYVRELTRRIAAARYEHGGAPGVSPAMRHIRQIASAVESRDKKLQMAASGLAVETVWTLSDGGQFDAGQKVGELALTLARLSGDADTQSRALSVLARVQHHRRDGGLAVKYAQQAVRIYDIPPQQQAWLKLRHAWSLSMVNGHEGEARNVLEQVGRFLGGPQDADRETADLMGSIGSALYDLGEYRQAQDWLDEAVRSVEDSWPRLHGVFLARQISASLRAAQPEYAADRMLTLACVVPLVNSARLNNEVKGVLAASRPWQAVPEVHAARTQLLAVSTDPSARQ